MSERIPNKERGEVAIKLGGQNFILRPTPEAVVAIETRVGRGLVSLGQRLARDEATLEELTAVVFEGLRAAGEPAVFKTVRGMVYATGYTPIALRILQFLVNATTGGRQDAEPMGEQKAAEANTSETTSAASLGS